MKTRSTFFSLMAVIMLINVAETNAQGRGKDRGGDREKSNHQSNRKEKDKRDRDDHRKDRRDNHEHQARRVVHHYHDNYCHHQPVVVHHHSARPRYIYYRDYDVYYDYTSSMYISFTGRNWVASVGIPASMRYVDVRRIKRYEIDYYHDDFARYLDRRGRPAYGRECDW